MMRNRPTPSTVDLVLLGFLYRESHSAYEIQKMIEYRNLSNWVKVSSPSVYKKILLLEKKGYVVGSVVREGKMPEKTMYSITETGRGFFSQLMQDTAMSPVQVLFDFNAVIANLDKLPISEAAPLFEKIRSSLEASKGFVEEHVPLRRSVPFAGQAIMDQQLRVFEVLLSWMDDISKKFPTAERDTL